MEEESLAAVIGRQKMMGGESIIQEKVSQKSFPYFSNVCCGSKRKYFTNYHLFGSNVRCLVLIIFIDFKLHCLFVSHSDIIYKLMALMCHGRIIFKHGFLFSLGFLVQIHWLTLLYRPY